MISFCVGQKLDHVMYDVSKISEEFLCCPFVKLFDASMYGKWQYSLLYLPSFQQCYNGDAVPSDKYFIVMMPYLLIR